MAFSSTLKFPVPVSGKDANTKRQIPTTFQVRSKAIQEPQNLTITRRDAMICLTTSVATTLLPMGPANARVVNLDIGQNIMEKLEKLLEMVGISKSKEDSSPGGVVKNPPVPLNDRPKKDEKPQEIAGKPKHEPKEKAENSKPKAEISNGNEEKKPPAPQNGKPTEKPAEVKNPK